MPVAGRRSRGCRFRALAAGAPGLRGPVEIISSIPRQPAGRRETGRDGAGSGPDWAGACIYWGVRTVPKSEHLQ
jgi:hypothetical protein